VQNGNKAGNLLTDQVRDLEVLYSTAKSRKRDELGGKATWKEGASASTNISNHIGLCYSLVEASALQPIGFVSHQRKHQKHLPDLSRWGLSPFASLGKGTTAQQNRTYFDLHVPNLFHF